MYVHGMWERADRFAGERSDVFIFPPVSLVYYTVYNKKLQLPVPLSLACYPPG